MQIMLKINNVKCCAVLLCAFFSSLSFSAGNDTSSIAFHVGLHARQSQATYQSKKIDKKLLAAWKLSDDVFFITPEYSEFDGVKYFWVVARLPSKAKSFGKGFCGAGTEDYLYLLSLEQGVLRDAGRFRIQSCLENFGLSLDNESHDSFGKNLAFSNGKVRASIVQIKEQAVSQVMQRIQIEYEFYVAGKKLSAKVLNQTITNQN